MGNVEVRIRLENTQEAAAVFGRNDEFLRLIAEHYAATRILTRGEEIVIGGAEPEVDQVRRLFEELLFLHRQGNILTSHEITYGMRLVEEGRAESLHRMFADTVIVTNRGKHIKSKTLGQWTYLKALQENAVTVGIGPAGTGKTYLAVAMAAAFLKKKEVERIILTRPAVEAGEKLGFLPGDLQEKVDPYLRPLYDALYDVIGTENFQKYMAKGIIEVAPLAYMRGRTLNDAFIILDEAQNTTPEQMKMFLTRLGFGSRMAVTGDVTQVDLPHGKMSGLKQAEIVLKDVPGVAIIRFAQGDVVRHELVGRIINAYERFERQNGLNE